MLAINKNLPGVIQVRSAECMGTMRDMVWLPSLPGWQVKCYVALVFVGFATLVYWAIALLQALVLQTPASI